jgi:ParB/RepB/Spo0J family partition protein
MSTTRIRDLAGVQERRDYFLVDPRVIVIEPGWNPREDFEGHEEMMASIREEGVKQPLWVKRGGEDGNGIILRDGQRRLTAVLDLIEQGVPIAKVPCLFTRTNMSEVEALCLTVLTNTGKPLNPLEEARAFARLRNYGLTQSEIAKRTNKSEGTVHNRLALLDTSPRVQEAVRQKELPTSEALALAKSTGGDVAKQDEALRTRPAGLRLQRTVLERILELLPKLGGEDMQTLEAKLRERLAQEEAV